MPGAGFHIDASDYLHLAEYWQRAPELTRATMLRAITTLDLDLQAQLKQDLPKGASGGLAKSIATHENALGDMVIGLVTTQLPYAEYVELGTRPHPVSEIGEQAIADWVRVKLGETNAKEALGIAHAIAWKIRRKGTKSQPVWTKTWDTMQGRIREVFDDALQHIAVQLEGGAA